MEDLKTILEQEARALRGLQPIIARIKASRYPVESSSNWERRSNQVTILEGTIPLFQLRAEAWRIVLELSIANNMGDQLNSRVIHGGLEMRFEVARHLAVTSYFCSAWAIYDRLSNFCGRLAAFANLSENPKSNPKLCGDIIDSKKDNIGFSINKMVEHSYAWPIKTSYKIRNWLVHEGYDEGSLPLFQGTQFSDQFLLHPDTTKLLEKCCDGKPDNGKYQFSRIEAVDETWLTRDLLRILPQYHAEIDQMFCELVTWVSQSFLTQIRSFAKRDQ